MTETSDRQLQHESRRARKFLQIIFGCLIAVLVVLSLILLAQYRTLQRQPYFGPHGSLLSSLKHRGTITPQDASLIESWMTFDYINRIFSLPGTYLQTTLNISDKRYPRLTIEEYAEDTHLSQSTVLIQIKNTVQSYVPATP
jgi:hypothetical protein